MEPRYQVEMLPQHPGWGGGVVLPAPHEAWGESALLFAEHSPSPAPPPAPPCNLRGLSLFLLLARLPGGKPRGLNVKLICITDSMDEFK